MKENIFLYIKTLLFSNLNVLFNKYSIPRKDTEVKKNSRVNIRDNKMMQF